MLNRVGKALRIISDEDKKKIAIILDGEMISEEYRMNKLKALKKAFNQIGTVRVSKIIFDVQISQKESDLLKSQGFLEEIVGSDLDIHMTLRSLEFMASKNVDIIAIGTTDPNLIPVMNRIKKEKNLAIITWEKDVTSAIESLADYILYLDYLK